MKVLMTTDTVGGVWTYAIELAGALRAYDVEIVLATMGRRLSETQRREAAALPNVSVRESTFRLEWMPNPWHDVMRAGEWLLALEHRERPAVVHLNSYTHGDLPWRAPVVVVAHSCVRSWWEAVRGGDVPDEWSTYSARVRRGVGAARHVVAPSHTMLSALVRHYGPLRSTSVIHNGRDARLFPPGRKERCIFAAGRVWDEAKNLAALDDVAAGLPWPVYIAGDDVSPTGERRTLGSAHALGALDRRALAWWLARSGIYAFPALYEPFGLSVLEAALGGCALVLGDIPSLREVWGDSATFVEPNDRNALSRALSWLCEDPLLRRAHAARARRRALLFSAERMAEQYYILYSDLRGPRRRVAPQPEPLTCVL